MEKSESINELNEIKQNLLSIKRLLLDSSKITNDFERGFFIGHCFVELENSKNKLNLVIENLEKNYVE